MQSFKWNDDFLTGLTEVDDQHRQLVELINQFGELVIEGKIKADNLESYSEKLTHYAQYHFQEEELLMEKMGIDSRHFNYHYHEHERFLQYIELLLNELNSSVKTDSRQLLNFLTQWLVYHILGVDQEMARQLRAIESGVSAQDAYVAERKIRSQSMGPLLAALTGLFDLLTERNKVLMELNNSLEAKVQERTQALTEANDQLQKVAMTDVLTELPNRRYAMSLLRQLWTDNSSTALACMMIDADGFKQINDKFGHDAGDLVLKALARELRYSIRNDDYVCRLGGDEFLIICTNTPLSGAMYLAEHVRKAIAELSVPAGEGIWHGSISVGVAVRTSNMENPDVLLKTADKGVYQSKADGRNCVRTCQPIVIS